MTIEETAKQLADRNLQKVSDSTGVSYYTVRGIARGESRRPAYEDVKKIVDYLEQN